jgi:hypothetical protein
VTLDELETVQLRPGGWAYLNLLNRDVEWTPRQKPRTVSASANVNPLDDVILVSGNSTLTLETAVGCDGRQHTLFKTDSSNTMTIACTGAETLNGAATVTRTGLYDCVTVKSNGTNWVLVGSFSVKPTLTDLTLTGNLVVNGNTTLGDASGDTLTINAGTWTLGSNATATRAMGAAAAGTTNVLAWATTFTGDSGGTSNVRSADFMITGSGGNAASSARAAVGEATWAGSATLTTLMGFNSALSLTSSGGVTTADVFRAGAITLSSTGVATTANAFHALDQGHATLVTNAHGFNCDNFTASATLTVSYRGQMTSGTGKWNAYMDGNADNAFAGKVRIGSTTAPTVPLDVTGDINGSTNFTAWTSYTPTRTGWTDVGTPTVTARYCQVRNVVFFQIKVVPATSVATVAGTSYVSLPASINASALGGDGSMVNDTTFVSVGNCVFDVSNSRCYVPSQTATGNTLSISGWYEV